MALDGPGLSFPAVLQNARLASRLAQIQAVANDQLHLTDVTTLASKSSRKDPYEGKRWVRRKDNAQFIGNPHIVAATKRDWTVQPPLVRPTFPEPLPPYLPRTEKLSGTEIPATEPLSANAGRFSLSLKGMRKTLRRSGNRAEVLVRHIENELIEWLWEGGTLLNPDLVSGPTTDADMQNLVLQAKPVRELQTVLEAMRTPLQLVWYIADDAFARYILHCCARYHEVVSYSKDVAGFRLTYLLRPNVTRPDHRAATALDTPPVTDIDYSSHPESDLDFLSDLSEKAADSDMELSERHDLDTNVEEEEPVAPAPTLVEDRPTDVPQGDVISLSEDSASQVGYVAVKLASLSVNSEKRRPDGEVCSDEPGVTAPHWYGKSTCRRMWSRSTSSPSRSPARHMARRRATLVRRYEPPKSTVTALGAARPQTLHEFIYS
ncbi:hypothetical protein M378DRAFT_76282 [Amanita muscaria Koide BX008]|uniref:Uncharacterized protein n=1 Tax=Amanita muscaria (strain Koide BX008) TaxID=946122 RepID=A0A0C2WVN9_AMAMK|nr:hypothetical protein M378DRAFT_76282 [Amanita muscaria Koide BX008]